MPDTLWTSGGSFAYLAEGDPAAPVVLCLHGFPDHPPSFAPLMSRLAAAGLRAVAPWLRGYAPSTLAGPYDVDRLAADVLEMADALSPHRPVALVGHDWGAAITYVAAARAPARVSAAVTMAVPHPLAFVHNLARQRDQLRRSWYMLFFQLRGLSDRVVAGQDFAFIDRLWRAWSPGYAPDARSMLELKRCLRASMPAPLGYYRAMLWPPRQALARSRPDGQAARPLSTAFLHLQGADDGCISARACRGQERFFSGAFRSETLPGVGHFMHLEDPERVARFVLDWLAPRAARG